MTMKSRWLIGMLLAVAAGTASAQLTDGGGGGTPAPNAGKPQVFPAGKCTGSVCRLRVHATGNCTVSVDPEWVFITGQAVHIIWELDQRDFYFPDSGGVTLKPQYAGSIGGQEGLVLGQKVDSQTWEAYDYNYQPSVARYSVTVVNRNTNASCSVDPGVINDWP
jgi:hypothetical protein